MWRALFYATGYLLIFLGVQSLAFERVQLAQGKDVRGFIKRMLNEQDPPPAPVSAQTIASQPTAVGGRSQSAYGASRFGSGGFGGPSFSASPYRDANVPQGLGLGSDRPAGVPRVDLAGYRTANSPQPAAVPSVNRKPGRVIEAQDWMPWSLLATGAVVVLYTRSFGLRSFGGG